MDNYTRIKTLENQLVHGKGLTIYELADKLHKSHSYLCRISSPTEDLPFPLEIALPAMKLKKDYNLLKYMALECGFALVKIPKISKSRKEENEMVSDYQSLAADTVKSLLEFLSHPDKNNYEKVNDKLQGIISESLAVKHYVDKKASPQLELGL